MFGDTLYTKAEGPWTMKLKKENFEYPYWNNRYSIINYNFHFLGFLVNCMNPTREVQEAVNLYVYVAMQDDFMFAFYLFSISKSSKPTTSSVKWACTQGIHLSWDFFKVMGQGLSALVWRGPKYMIQLFFDSCKVRHILCTEFQNGPACEERTNESFGLGLEENQKWFLGLGSLEHFFGYILNVLSWALAHFLLGP